MESNLGLTTFGYLQLGLTCIALGVLTRMPGKVCWRSLQFSLAVDVVTQLILALTLNSQPLYATYFYTFWVSAIVQLSLRLWILADVARSFSGLGFLSARFASAIACLAFVLASSVGLYSLHLAPNLRAGLHCIMLYHASIDLAWMVFALALLVAARFLHAVWDPLAAAIVNGLIAEIICAGITGTWMTQSQNTQLWSDFLNSLCAVVVLFFWVNVFFRIASSPESNTSRIPSTPQNHR